VNSYDRLEQVRKHVEAHYTREWEEVSQGVKHHYWGQRIVAELAYALDIIACGENKYDKLVDSAIINLYDIWLEQGDISKDTVVTIEQQLMPMKDTAKNFTLYLASHAHIDMNWMWGYNETVTAVVETMRTMLQLLEEFPKFRFSQSQAAVYQIIEKYAPELIPQIIEYINCNRWEVTAGTWVEHDKNLADTESHVRQVLCAQKYLSNLLGIDADSLNIDFEPDTFGHAKNTPDMLSQAGIEYMYFCRGYEGERIFNWLSDSGKTVLAVRETEWYARYVQPSFIANVASRCSQYSLKFDFKVFGVGNHGGGPTRADLHRIDDMSNWPISPKIEFSFFGEYFKKLDTIKATIPQICGELNPVFSGVYSANCEIKRANRVAEDRLYFAEAFQAFADPHKSNNSKLDAAWQETLFSQFHDIVTGVGTKESKFYCLAKFQETIAITDAITANNMRAIAQEINTMFVPQHNTELLFDKASGAGVGFSQSNSITYSKEVGEGEVRIVNLFNLSEFINESAAEIVIWDYPSDVSNLCAISFDGSELPIELLESGDYWAHKFQKILIHTSIPAFGYTTCYLLQKERTGIASPKDINPRIEHLGENILENNKLIARFDRSMQLVKLVDKTSGKDIFNNQPTAYLVYEDHNARTGNDYFFGKSGGNAWVIGETLLAKNIQTQGRVFVLDRKHGPIRNQIDYSMEFGSSRVKASVWLDTNDTSLQYSMNVDFREFGTNNDSIPVLKFCLPVPYAFSKTMQDSPFSMTKRAASQHDSVGRNICFLQNDLDNNGAYITTETLYGYALNKTGMEVTLLRNSAFPDVYPEIGEHFFQFSVGICSSREQEIIKASRRYSRPLQYIANTRHEGSLIAQDSFMQLTGNAKVIACKNSDYEDNAWIIRVLETAGKDGVITFKTKHKIFKTQIVDLRERLIQDIKSNGNKLEIVTKPHELLTLKINFE